MAANVPNDDKDSGDGGKKPAPEQSPIALAVDALKKEYETAQADRKEHERKVFRWTRNAGIGVGIYTALTAFIMAASIYAAVQSKNSVDATNRAVQAALAANEIAIRPYIKVILNPNTFSMPVDASGGFNGVTFQIENTGRLPGLAYIQSAVDWTGKGHEHQAGKWPSINHVADEFIFPGAPSAQLRSNTLSISRGQLLDLMDTMSGPSPRFYVMVDVLYGPSGQYETRVCNFYGFADMPKGPLRLWDETICPEEGSNYAK